MAYSNWTKYSRKIELTVRERAIGSKKANVLCNVDDSEVSRSFFGLIQLYSDKTATSHKCKALCWVYHQCGVIELDRKPKKVLCGPRTDFPKFSSGWKWGDGTRRRGRWIRQRCISVQVYVIRVSATWDCSIAYTTIKQSKKRDSLCSFGQRVLFASPCESVSTQCSESCQREKFEDSFWELCRIVATFLRLKTSLLLDVELSHITLVWDAR